MQTSNDDEITPDDYRLDATPVDWQAAVFPPGAGGVGVDITRELRVMYDLVVGSLDFGSHFFDAEDAEVIWRIAELCDFDFREYKVASTNIYPDGCAVHHGNLNRADFLLKYNHPPYEVREEQYIAGQTSLEAIIPGRKRGES